MLMFDHYATEGIDMQPALTGDRAIALLAVIDEPMSFETLQEWGATDLEQACARFGQIRRECTADGDLGYRLVDDGLRAQLLAAPEWQGTLSEASFQIAHWLLIEQAGRWTFDLASTRFASRSLAAHLERGAARGASLGPSVAAWADAVLDWDLRVIETLGPRALLPWRTACVEAYAYAVRELGLHELRYPALVARDMRAMLLVALGDLEGALLDQNAAVGGFRVLAEQNVGGAATSLVIARRLRADTLERLGRVEEALAERRLAARAHRRLVGRGEADASETAQVEADVARLLSKLGRHDEALAAWGKILPRVRGWGSGPSYGEIINGYAWALFAASRIGDAIETLHRAVANGPTEGESVDAALELRSSLSSMLGAAAAPTDVPSEACVELTTNIETVRGLVEGEGRYDLRPLLVELKSQRAGELAEAGDFAGAAAAYEELIAGLAGRSRTPGSDVDTIGLELRCARAGVLSKLGVHDVALQDLGQIVDSYRALIDVGRADLLVHLVGVWDTRIAVLEEAGLDERALAERGAVVAELGTAVRAGRADLWFSLLVEQDVLAMALRAAGRLEEALVASEQAVAGFERYVVGSPGEVEHLDMARRTLTRVRKDLREEV